MLLNCGVGEDSWEFLGLQADPTSPFWRRSVLGVHWKEWCWSWNSNTLATWCQELTHLKRPWCSEGLRAGEEGDNRGWDGWMASPTQWTWVWVNSGNWLMDREAWRAVVHGVAKNQTWLSDWTELKSIKGKPGATLPICEQKISHRRFIPVVKWSCQGYTWTGFSLYYVLNSILSFQVMQGTHGPYCNLCNTFTVYVTIFLLFI